MHHLLQRARLQTLHCLEHRLLDLRQIGSRMSLAPRDKFPCHRLARRLPARQRPLQIVLVHCCSRVPYRQAGRSLYRITQNYAGHPPQLVGARGLEPAECTRLATESSAVQTALTQVLVDGALGDADAVAGEQDSGDLGGGPSWQLGAECARLVQQLRMAAHRT
jgi:hypothetical protein